MRFEALSSVILLNCPNWTARHFFLRVLIGISYDLCTLGIPRAFSDGIRLGNAVRLQLEVKLRNYQGLQGLNMPETRSSKWHACGTPANGGKSFSGVHWTSALSK
jgi:hypothetical protein